MYLRFTRDASPVFTTEHAAFEIGKAQLLRDGTDVAIIGCGPILYSALLAADQLQAENISVLVLNSHTVKPIDAAAITAVAKKCGAVVTVEEHQVMGGCGSAVCEVLAREHPVPVEMVGMQDTFGESGTPGELLAKYGMDTHAIVTAIRRALSRKGKQP